MHQGRQLPHAVTESALGAEFSEELDHRTANQKPIPVKRVGPQLAKMGIQCRKAGGSQLTEDQVPWGGPGIRGSGHRGVAGRNGSSAARKASGASR